MNEKADFIVIGSGQGGVPLARKLAERGQEVVLFERDAWGGTCINYGCIPSKTLLASAHVAASARMEAGLGVGLDTETSFPAVMERVRRAITPDRIRESLEKAGVQLVPAEAEFVGAHTVRAGSGGEERIVEAETIVINTGKGPVVPDIPGLAGTPYLTYKTVWQLEERPRSIAILGGGYSGLELAQAFQRLGSQVHVLELEERVVIDEEKEVGLALQHALEGDGVHFLLNTRMERVAYTNGLFRLTLDTKNDPLIVDQLLVAAGRRPNTAALHLEKWGIATDEHGHVAVDDRFRTTMDGVYAIGDVTGQPAFTHVSWEDHRRLLSILSGGGRRRGDRVLGYAFFTEPQVGRAGLTYKQATAAGYAARAATLRLGKVSARAAATGHAHGFYRMVVDGESDRILGATLVGPQAAELIHIFIAHMEAGSTWHVLERSQHIHPTYAEDLPVLARQLCDSTEY